ncbi:MarR family transcriptional regulator [Agrococcus sediminis]|uniref:MarR family transcriptional regulator n=1 Tax=Agrococcus sediminis TaxID=2599924 RepID=A0A5M8QKM9_9MICO|nr:MULTISPECIES: MarR family transcriptional regulator [Agrococcus]KAA6435213.1 MarR family transcriptional regulator [Agrococcus sediminis]MDR7233528.1 DNA-binding MarR family transcriptional regulator [Agrococcus sp. BE272]RWR24675.1 MarR family transcriptional regulator [Agrococcus lahaulensis]
MPSNALADSLRVALVRMGRRMRRERGDESLSLHHLSALGAMQQLEEPTLARIAAAECVKPPSMVKTLQHLEALGYVERSDHPSDGRMVVFRISGKGDAMIAETRERRNRALAAAIERLDPAEREILEKAVPLIERLAEA